MPTCLKSVRLVDNSGVGRIWVANATGTGIDSPATTAMVLVPDASLSMPNCTAVAISGAEYIALQSGSGSGTGTPGVVDYEACAYLWSFGVTTVVTLYLVSKYVGEIVGFIRSVIR